MLKRIYLSGPITNIPELNRPAFDAAEKRLTASGHFVINPVNISVTFGTEEELAKSFIALYDDRPFGSLEYSPKLAHAVMDADLAAVHSCDAIYLLRGWETSRGAKKELAEALKYGLQVMQEGDAK